MGKKGKGTKKEDKPKKDVPPTNASKKAMQEALEGTNVTVSTPTPRATPPTRPSASKKSDRGGSAPIKVGCTEGFRWDNSEKGPVLPPMGQRAIRNRISLLAGLRIVQEPLAFQALQHLCGTWNQYLTWRCQGDAGFLESALRSKTLKDGLSGPILITRVILDWLIQGSRVPSLEAMETDEPLHVVVIGATAAYEEKILRESNYWDELFTIFSGRKVRLYLTGPEMSGKDGEFKRKRPGTEEGQHQQEDGHRVECWKTNAIDFFLKKDRLALFEKEDTVVVGLNCGFDVAARRMLTTPVAKQEQSLKEALWNWIPTLNFIAALELPLLITGSDKQDSPHSRLVLEYVVGMYCVQDATRSSMPAETVISGSGSEVRANTFYTVVQGGQQPGHSFDTSQAPIGGNDPRFDELRKIANREQFLSSKKWRKRSQHEGIRERVSPLVPLKRYGNFPPENREKSSHDDHGESESDVPVGAGRGKEQEKEKERGGLLPPAVIELKHSVVDEGPSSLKIIVEDVFMTDPATARVGMRRNRFALHYFDCQTLRDVVFEAALAKEVDHTTTQVTFKRSAASIAIVARMLDSTN